MAANAPEKIFLGGKRKGGQSTTTLTEPDTHLLCKNSRELFAVDLSLVTRFSR